MSNKKGNEPELDQRSKSLLTATVLLIVVLGVLGCWGIFGAKSPHIEADALPVLRLEADTPIPTEPPTEEPTEPPAEEMVVFYPEVSPDMVEIKENQLSAQHAVLIDVDNNQLLAAKGDPEEKIYPASMTKLMTLIVAVENVEDTEATFTITNDLLSPLWAQEASMAGFANGEEVPFKDLLYGAALPSGADATSGLAIMTAGSEEAFVAMMNAKCEELGLKNTHFVNTSGLYDENHYSTPTDMALIMEYCLKLDLVREIISTNTYRTTSTDQHPDGIELTNTMFKKMYGTEVQGITIKGGKTGFTDEAGQCLASYAMTQDDHLYVAVSSKGAGVYSSAYDAFKLYGIVTGTYGLDD